MTNAHPQGSQPAAPAAPPTQGSGGSRPSPAAGSPAPPGHLTAKERALSAVDAVAAAVAGLDRPEFASRLAALRRRLRSSSCTVLVVGEFKKGKSTLINALVHAQVCPVDDDIATAKPVAVRHSPDPTAEIVLYPDAGDDQAVGERRPIPFELLSAYATETAGAPDVDRVERVVIGLPRNLLEGGLVLVDTPGVGGLGSPHTAATVAALPSADAVLFVTDASQELTQSEMEFLRTARAMCPRVMCIMTKTDFYPSWRTILQLNQDHLSRNGLPGRIIAASAPLRTHAVVHNDTSLNVESGYAELVQLLRDELAPQVAMATAAGVAAELAEILDLHEAQLRAELAALEDPERSADSVRELERTKEQAERLRGQAARWQHTLNDGVADLVADVEHDLRARSRELVREADELIDTGDPAKFWAEFEPWLTRRATSDVVQNLTLLHQRSVQLCARVAQHFDADHREVAARLDIPAPTELSVSGVAQATFKPERPSFISQTVSALRGSTGGFMMVSVLSNLAHTTFAGLALAPSPLLLGGVTLMMGRKTFRDERHRMLAQRRAQAKQVVRRYTDDVVMLASKDTRDGIRRVNRQLRDHYVERAELLTSSTAEALSAAQNAVRASEQRRMQRRKEVVELLERTSTARRVAAQVVSRPAAQPSADTGARPASAAATARGPVAQPAGAA